MYLLPEDLRKHGMEVVAGGLIGIERQLRDKPASVRALIAIPLGAPLFTIRSSRLAGVNDPTRTAAGTVAGVGFLGAGVIMWGSGRVGLVMAAAIWLTAALGMSIGAGQDTRVAAGLAVSLAEVRARLRTADRQPVRGSDLCLCLRGQRGEAAGD